ncbi:MAG: hypothetical protein ACOYNR_05445 [Blastocatellia bacterium]
MAKKRAKGERAKSGPSSPGSASKGRRRVLIGIGAGVGLGLVGLGGYRAGWFGGELEEATTATRRERKAASPLPPLELAPTQAGAIQAATEIVTHYTRALDNASAGIHAVRAMGQTFRLADGTLATETLCSRYAQEKIIGDRRYVYFPREHEVHDNSFLKTFLEAGVGSDHLISAGGQRYTLRDLGESAKALFRFDPTDIRRFDPVLPEEHLPWGLIAFSILVPPTEPRWTNTFGETIDLNEVIDRGLADFEAVCRLLLTPETPAVGESVAFRSQITRYSCGGFHSTYSFFSAYRHGYRSNNLRGRLEELADNIITRLQRDADANRLETEVARTSGQKYISQMGIGRDGKPRGEGPMPTSLIDVLSLVNAIKLTGHALETLNYVRLHDLLPFSSLQLRRMVAGEESLYRDLVRLRSYDLDAYYRWDPKFVSDLVIAVAHALRGIKLLGPDNPDLAGKAN